MRQAVRLARKGLGRTSPNPPVGAVVIHRARTVGRGYHRSAGAPHAEAEALAEQGKYRELHEQASSQLEQTKARLSILETREAARLERVSQANAVALEGLDDAQTAAVQRLTGDAADADASDPEAGSGGTAGPEGDAAADAELEPDLQTDLADGLGDPLA